MSYLIAVLVTTLLLCGFIVLSSIETTSQKRLFGGTRRKFDKQVARVAYVITHIDWAAFFAHVTKSTLERVAHDVVHTTLLAVRATERSLTRAIRTLRERVATHGPDEPVHEGSQLVATIVKFRKNLTRDKKPVAK